MYLSINDLCGSWKKNYLTDKLLKEIAFTFIMPHYILMVEKTFFLAWRIRNKVLVNKSYKLIIFYQRWEVFCILYSIKTQK